MNTILRCFLKIYINGAKSLQRKDLLEEGKEQLLQDTESLKHLKRLGFFLTHQYTESGRHKESQYVDIFQPSIIIINVNVYIKLLSN